MRFSLDQVQIFVAAAREKSFSATGRRLGKTQSAISMAVQDLEVDLGVTLFDRSSRYPVLTPAGEALLSEAEAILSRCESMQERASALTSNADTHLAIALEVAFPAAALAPVLKSLHAMHPGVRLDVLQPMRTDLVETVLNGAAALGLGCARPHYPQGIGFVRLGQLTFINTVHRDHPLAQLPSVGFAQLADYLQIVLAAQSNSLLTSEYLISAKKWFVDSQLALIDLIKGGLGWGIVPRWMIAPELASGELKELSLDAYPFTQWTVGLDLIVNVQAKPGSVVTWLKSELARTRAFA